MFNDKFHNFIDDFWENEKRRIPNFIPVGIGLGICLYFSLDKEPNFLLNASTILLILVLCIFFKKTIFYVLLTICLGFFTAQLRTKMLNTFMMSDKNDDLVSLVATVESCEKTEKGLTFIVNDICSRRQAYLTNFNKLHLTWRGKKAMVSREDYVPGSRVLFRVILSPIYPQAFPGAYDFRKQQYFRGVGARGFITIPPKILDKPKSTTLYIFMQQLRHTLDNRIENCLPTDTASVAKALITGNKSGVSQVIRQHFANSGTAHLLAISGLHMSIIGFFIFCFFRIFLCFFPPICQFYDTKKIAAVISWLAALFYLNISGRSVPSLRAFIMHTLIICAILLERRALTMRSVAIAATIIMLFSPEVIQFPSFQMSFGAVIVIVAFFERTWNVRGFFRTLFDAMATTVVASIPTALFSMHTFNQLTLNSIPANLVSIPLMSFFIMPIAVIALFLTPFGWEQPFILLMGHGVNLLIKISELSAQLPGSHFVMPTPTATTMEVFIFSGLILTLIHHRIRLLGVLGLVIGVVHYCYSPVADIFISPEAKVVGVRTSDAVCFSHLGYFRSITSSWARSVGFEKREQFSSPGCRKYISKISDDTYDVQLGNQRAILTYNEDYPVDSRNTIFLDRDADFAKVIYLRSCECLSSECKLRPWN
ncbi:MAG: ComEC family competence protein [Holosporaceae bacterium]|jgi:competence protein ComEC|nr:ComEC family competence protein [Holosporaceae bacterium]